MKVRINGEMTLAELWQSLYEVLHNIEQEYSVRYSRGATLYINPSNGFGGGIIVRDSKGKEVRNVTSSGPYRSAADEYKI